jgi:hypothetical protein
MKRLIAFLFLCLPFMSFAQKDVTFIVDMRDYSGSYNGVYVNGTWNSWCGTCNPMSDPEGDSVWTVTLPLTADSVEYKFTLDGWTGQESLTSGTTCTKTTGIYTNRFAVLNGDTILPGVAWESCGPKSGQVYMTFQVNMEYTAVDSTGVYLAGGTGSELLERIKCILLGTLYIPRLFLQIPAFTVCSHFFPQMTHRGELRKIS